MTDSPTRKRHPEPHVGEAVAFRRQLTTVREPHRGSESASQTGCCRYNPGAGDDDHLHKAVGCWRHGMFEGGDEVAFWEGEISISTEKARGRLWPTGAMSVPTWSTGGGAFHWVGDGK